MKVKGSTINSGLSSSNYPNVIAIVAMSHDSYDLTVYYDSSKWYTIDTLGPNAYFGVYYF